MTKGTLSIFLASLTAVCFVAQAAQAEDDAQTYFLCKNGAAVRTVRVEQKEMACRAYYTKNGIDKMVGKSGTPDVCLQVVTKIKTNLESGSWKCRDISQTRVSSAD